MKVVSVKDAAPQLGKLITDALNGEAIYLTNGASRVQLMPSGSHESEIDFNSPELKTELLRGLEGMPEPYSDQEIKEACREALRTKKSS